MATMKPFGGRFKSSAQNGKNRERTTLISNSLLFFGYRGTQKFCMLGNNIRERYTSDNTVKKKRQISMRSIHESIISFIVQYFVLSSLFAWIFSRQCSSHFSSPLSPVLLARQVSKFPEKKNDREKKGNKVHTIRHFVRFDGQSSCTFFFPLSLSLYGHYIILLATKNNTDSFFFFFFPCVNEVEHDFILAAHCIYIHAYGRCVYFCMYTETFASSYSMTISTLGQGNHQNQFNRITRNSSSSFFRAGDFAVSQR